MSGTDRVADVSVITRTKDRPQMLRRALQSIGQQTHRGFELVVVNDGGAAVPVRELLDEFSRNHADIPLRQVHNATSSGRAGAINDGLRAASAPLYVLHDDDDTWEASFLAETVAFLDAHPDSVGVATRTRVISEHEEDGALVEDHREVLASVENTVTLLNIARHNFVPPICLVIRREASDRVGGFKPSQHVQEDWDFLLRLLLAGPVGFIDGEPLANWHHRSSASGAELNSIFAEASEHRNAGANIRDAFLREPDHRELGLVLALAQYTNDLSDQVNARHDAVGQALDGLRIERSEREQEILAAVNALAEQLRVLEHQTGEAGLGELPGQVRGLAANVEEAHKKLDRIGSSLPRRLARRLLRGRTETAARQAPAPTPPEREEPLRVPASPNLTGNRWLDNDDYRKGQ